MPKTRKDITRVQLKKYLRNEFDRLDTRGYFGSWQDDLIEEFVRLIPKKVKRVSSFRVDKNFRAFLSWNPFGAPFKVGPDE